MVLYTQGVHTGSTHREYTQGVHTWGTHRGHTGGTQVVLNEMV